MKTKMHKTLILLVISHACETWFLTPKEEQRLRAFKNRVLQKRSGPVKSWGKGGGCRKLHTQLYHLHSSLNNIWVTKLRMKWRGDMARMEKRKCAHNVFSGKPARKIPLGRPGQRMDYSG